MEVPFNKRSVDKLQFLIFLKKFLGLHRRKTVAVYIYSKKADV